MKGERYDQVRPSMGVLRVHLGVHLYVCVNLNKHIFLYNFPNCYSISL